MPGQVIAVSCGPDHGVGKPRRSRIHLIAGVGVDGDAHAGTSVQHRSRVARDASQPNLRQVHLIHAELHEELRARGFEISPGDMGENVTTEGVDLLGLPTGARLGIGDAMIEVTGLRNPCKQLDELAPGLMAATLERSNGRLVRKAGVMGVVVTGGSVAPGDPISVVPPAKPHRPLEPV